MKDFSINIKSEGLIDKGEIIDQGVKEIRKALADVDTARKSLEAWVSSNKERYDSKVAKGIPALYEMTEVVESFAKVAIQTANRAVAVENKIAAAIENDDIAA